MKWKDEYFYLLIAVSFFAMTFFHPKHAYHLEEGSRSLSIELQTENLDSVEKSEWHIDDSDAIETALKEDELTHSK